ncbi:aldo/keto reductase [Natronococcus jeotgali]|uniref:Aldo/keto reductase n=1 Tax=Natronococcus jeotgali DSM 18795 TaxID=1227498 RepID=L9XWS6_9EURY|nr:aldo/keto reductase [Natronococcus jeotgali]ELY66225.1 aldo/keto reductase [Natronococcus jeotgali DSM 18795]
MIDSSTIDAGNAAIPALGFGTARMTGEECRRAVAAALEAGYRHLDTAQLYDNENAVGDALAASDVPREDVFVVTKLDTDNLARDAVLESTRRSCERLGLETIDLLLIHAPRDQTPLEETLGAMNELQAGGRVDHVGVSNFSVEQLERARELSETPIVANQVKYHPYNRQDELVSYCADNDVCLTAYSPLAAGAVVGDDRLAEIGERYGKSASQVALRWLLQQPAVAAIPKAASPEHVAANADVFDFELSPTEMRRVFELTDPRLTARIASLLGLD